MCAGRSPRAGKHGGITRKGPGEGRIAPGRVAVPDGSVRARPLSYRWHRENEAMLKRFQDEEERHLAWLAAKHDALGGHADPEGPDTRSP